MQTREKPGAVLRSAASPDETKSGRSAESEVVRTVVQKYAGRKRAVIQVLQDVQERFRWLAPGTLEAVALELGVPLAHVYSVATFYKSFSLAPRGRHICTVCMGTACHVRGGAAILEHFERKLGLRAGQTSADGEVTLERVNCLGACALAPLAVVDGRYYGQMNETKANAVLEPILDGGTVAGENESGE
jgi:NADH-quinone oxidoreductase subunit E